MLSIPFFGPPWLRWSSKKGGPWLGFIYMDTLVFKEGRSLVGLHLHGHTGLQRRVVLSWGSFTWLQRFNPFGSLGYTRDNSAGVLFPSFLQEVLVSSSGLHICTLFDVVHPVVPLPINSPCAKSTDSRTCVLTADGPHNTVHANKWPGTL